MRGGQKVEHITEKPKLEYKPGQLFGLDKPLPRPPINSAQNFSNDTITGLHELGSILKSIRERALLEGYEIENGTFVK